MPSKKAKWRKYMKEYCQDKQRLMLHIILKNMIETEYHQDYYASNLEPSHEKSVLSSNIYYHKAPEKNRRKSI